MSPGSRHQLPGHQSHKGKRVISVGQRVHHASEFFIERIKSNKGERQFLKYKNVFYFPTRRNKIAK